MNQLDARASDTGRRVLSTAESLKIIAEELRSDELSRPAAQLADRGAATLEQLGQYLERSNGDRLLSDAERFGRERPWVLASVGVALGLAGSRMLKASAARRYRYDGYDEVPERAAYVPVSSDAAPLSAASSGSAASGRPTPASPAPSYPGPDVGPAGVDATLGGSGAAYDAASESIRQKAAGPAEAPSPAHADGA